MGRYGSIIVESGQGAAVRYQLDARQISVGRGPENDIVLLDRKVSRRHALLICDDDGVTLRDRGSSNGFVHQQRRVREARLQHGDQLRIGATILHYQSAESDLQSEDTMLTNAAQMLDRRLPEAGAPRLIVVESGRSHSVVLSGQTISIGRSSKADLSLQHPDVSRFHAELRPMLIVCPLSTTL